VNTFILVCRNPPGDLDLSFVCFIYMLPLHPVSAPNNHTYLV